MRFLSVRELRGKSAEIWRRLVEEREIVITSKGKPMALLSSVDEESFESALSALRTARALAAASSMQRRSSASKTGKLSFKEIDAEIARVRRERGA